MNPNEDNHFGLLSGEAVPNTQSASLFGAAPSGYGSMYDQLFAANPYRKQTYNQSGWQHFLSSLGFRTGYDDWLDQTSTQIAEYDAGIYSMMQQNKFNSPVAQAERMRDAGLNPDLQGLGDVVQAAQPAEDANGMTPQNSEQQMQQAFDVVSRVSSSVLNLIPSTLSFAQSLTQMKGMRLENDLKEGQIGLQALDGASKFFIEGITEQEYKEAFEKNDWSNILEASKKDAKYLAETLFSSSSARKKFNLAYGLHSNSLLARMQKYQTYDEFEKNRKSLLDKRASPYFSDDDDTMQSLMNAFLTPIYEYQKRINDINFKKAQLRNPVAEQMLENTQIVNQQAYENTIDPTLQAQAENTANDYQTQQNEIMKATDDLFHAIMTNLSAHDNWWSKIAMALIGIARAQIMSGIHAQFGRNSHYSVNGDTGVISEQGASNFGLSF